MDESYSVESTKESYRKGLISKETCEVSIEYIQSYRKYEKAHDKMGKHFNSIFMKKIKESSTLDELLLIKKELREMPESAAKVLIFRAIIFQEDKIKSLNK